MSLPTLYEDQAHTMGEVSNAWKVDKRVILRAACGWGKTHFAGQAFRRAFDRGHRCYFIVHRKELIAQTERTFLDWGLKPGIVSHGHKKRYGRRIQICSVASMRTRIAELPKPSMVAVDECRHSAARTWAQCFAAWNDAYYLGLDATPIRHDGTGLADYFDSMVCGLPESELISMGRLSDYRAYSHPTSREGLHRRGGEYIMSEQEDRVILGDAVDAYRAHGQDQLALGFAPTIKYSKAQADAFCEAGIPAMHVDGETPAAIRAEAIQRFAKGELRVLYNVGLFGEGFDLSSCAGMPVNVRVGLFNRITGSLANHIQMAMRPMRAGEGDATLIDLAGNFRQPELGLPDDDREWSLTGSKDTELEKPAPKRPCPKCFFLCAPSAKECPECGTLMPRVEREIKTRDGELEEIDRGQRMGAIQDFRHRLAQCRTYEQLVLFGEDEGYRFPREWAEYQMKEQARR